MRGTRLSYAEKDKKKHGDPLRMITHKYNILYLARGTEQYHTTGTLLTEDRRLWFDSMLKTTLQLRVSATGQKQCGVQVE